MSTDFAHASYPVLAGPDADRAREAGVAKGHAAGYAEGMRAAQAELAQRRMVLETEYQAMNDDAGRRLERVLVTLGAATHALNGRLAASSAASMNALAVAAFELAEAIIGVELDRGSTAPRAAVSRALSGVDSGAALRVRLNPLDLAELSGVEHPAGVELVPDASLARGDAMTETNESYLDARIGTALQRAKEALLGNFRAAEVASPSWNSPEVHESSGNGARW
ncbi:hypothetical protein GCM10027403_37610 [Arthrobacter tecti]